MGERADGRRGEPERRERVRSVRELRVYQNAFDGAMRIFQLSKRFPVEERYSLTDQIRRSSRSVCANLAEAWRKRRYKAAFVAKLSDAQAEASETQVWLEFGLAAEYLVQAEFDSLTDVYDHVVAQLVLMSGEAEKWLIPQS